MSRFLSIISDYHHIHVLLCDGPHIIRSMTEDKMKSNRYLLSMIDTILDIDQFHLSDLSFIGVNLGPGPYTSLRIVLATANGLHAATGIPLVGIDALQAFVHEFPPTLAYPTTIALLNAFNFDVFYAIAQEDVSIKTGYKSIDQLLAALNKDLPRGMMIRFLGNGAVMYNDNIKKQFKKHAYLPDPMPIYPSLEQLIKTAWHNWQAGKTTEHVLPLYLKQLTYKSSVQVA